MPDLPTRTMTFLFTDIVGSTTIAQRFPTELPGLLARHHSILNGAAQTHHGHVFRVVGDSFQVAFDTAQDALNAALAAQNALQQEAWQPAPITVRMGVHTGLVQIETEAERLEDYGGYLTLTRTQRIMSVAHGGQVLLSNATKELLAGELPSGITFWDMGEHRLKGLANLEHLWQTVGEGLRSEFPPLASLVTSPNNLLAQPTSFVGRSREIAEVEGLLSTTRLLTLTG